MIKVAWLALAINGGRAVAASATMVRCCWSVLIQAIDERRHSPRDYVYYTRTAARVFSLTGLYIAVIFRTDFDF